MADMHILKKHGLKLTAGTLIGFLAFGMIILIATSILFWFLGIGIYEMFTKFDSHNFHPSDASTYEFRLERFFTSFGYDLFSFGYDLLLFIPISLFVYFGIYALFTAGLIGSVNDAVYRDQSSVGSYVTYGLEKFWKTFRIVVLNFLVISLPLWILQGIISMISSRLATLGILLHAFLFLLVLIPINTAINHGFILSFEKNLKTWESVKAGWLTFIRAYRQTYISALLVLGSILGVSILLGISILIISGFVGSGPRLFILASLLAVCVIPFMVVISQMIITKRLKEIIEPRVFGSNFNNLDSTN